MKNNIEISEVIPPVNGSPVLVHFVPSWLPVLRVLLAGLYRSMVGLGGLALVWNGSSPWLLLALLPLFVLGPRSR